MSDQESGDPRQWYWLEIAQTMPAAQKTPRTRLLGIAIKLFGNKAFSPILLLLKIKGAELYQQVARQQVDFAQKTLCDALLFSGSVLALLAGFQLLTASLQFALWCFGLTASAWQIWRNHRLATPETQLDIEASEMEKLGSESSLGLTGCLLAAGIPATVSLKLLAGIKDQPATVLNELLVHYPRLAPNTNLSKALKNGLTLSINLTITAIGSWLIGISPQYWGLGLVMVLFAILAAGILRQKHVTMMLLTTWLACFALASISHYI
ncbi:hypothetical protein NT239_03655 [Chitinibacter sp. SCUT-21]|uniref:hypothetical protein n=1 Tax=Chitinibacter sp. SCUT-21 TaxID=2970891 RepID=UPI0035A729EB